MCDPDVTFYVKQPVDDEGIPWKRRREDDRLLVVCNGNHVTMPFQCDLCIFRLLHGEEPRTQSAQDALLMACIRWVNLDAFWSHEKLTVESNFNTMKRVIQFSETVGLGGGYPSPVPFPFEDVCGYEVAIQMVLVSKWPGKHSPTYTQFEMIHLYRSSFFNMWQVTQGTKGTLLSTTNEIGMFSHLGSWLPHSIIVLLKVSARMLKLHLSNGDSGQGDID
jgi:hypothetical protein